MNFCALDVETANYNHSSICQIGIGIFESGSLVNNWKSYIDPESFFHWKNIEIHGICENTVVGAPKIVDVYDQLKIILENKIVVHHTSYDRVAFDKVYAKYNLDPINIIWLDSSKIARYAWQEFSTSGYNLANIANHIGIQFKHHDALEDAIAAGLIVVEACKKLNLTLDDWVRLM
jgi:DNA polymerase III subunit epsilon